MFLSFLQSAIRFSTVFLFGSTGEIITEKSGHLNLGIPGIMCVGAIGGCYGEVMYLNSLSDISQISAFGAIFIPILAAMLSAGAMGLVYSFFTVTLRCNQNVTGLTITTFGIGIIKFFGARIDKTGFSVASKLFTRSMFGWSGSGWFGELFLSYGILVYLAIAVALVTSVVLNRTRIGLYLRAVGESPATADAAGINVSKYKYLATLIGSAIAGLGGLFYEMDHLNGNIEYSVDEYAWMAVALVIFSVWKPNWSIVGSILFGALYKLPSLLGVSFARDALVQMVPYGLTILVLIITSAVSKKENQPPAALGMSYFREER